MIRSRLAFGFLFLVGCSASAPATAPEELTEAEFGALSPVAFELLPAHKARASPGVVVLTSSASYQAFFGEPPPSSIDFSTDMVLNYALGLKPTGGYGVLLKSVQRRGRSLRIGVTSIAPGPSCALPPVSVHPDVTAKVKASRLVALRVVLSPLVACPNDQALCEASAGKWDSPGCKGDVCACGMGNAFVASAGGCVSNDDAKAACVASRGAWDPRATPGGGLCTCPATMRFVRRYGRCAWDEDLCIESGGAWRDDDANAQGLYCDCHAPLVWIPDHGGCVEA